MELLVGNWQCGLEYYAASNVGDQDFFATAIVLAKKKSQQALRLVYLRLTPDLQHS